ncbi:MAG TPA: hypothetical protein VME46_18305 [Acidimicrobiales bacterium]|nr:hypothetical protein [Acidimicrobiales bacterium]
MSLTVNIPPVPRIWGQGRGQAKREAAVLGVNEKRGKGHYPAGLSTALVGLAVLAVTTALCTAMVLSAHSTGAGKGVSSLWVWLMTVGNLASLYGVSRGMRWGPRLGIGAQPLAITYCVLTSQVGFVPGNVVILLIHIANVRKSLR